MCFDAAGNLWVLGHSGNLVKISPGGGSLTIIVASGLAAPSNFGNLVIDPTGNFYWVSDGIGSGISTIRKLTQALVQSDVTNFGGVHTKASGLAYDATTNCLYAMVNVTTGGVTHCYSVSLPGGSFVDLASTTFNFNIVPPTGPISTWTPSGHGNGWLVVDEPGGIFTDRSTFLFLGQGAKHSITLQSRQRGTASFTLVSDPQDPTSAPSTYMAPGSTSYQGVPVFLMDQNTQGYVQVFSGLIQDYTSRYVGITGLRYIDVTAVAFESVLDTIYADGTDLFLNQNCGTIVSTLFNKYENGSQVTLGAISPGATIPSFNPQIGQKLSEIIAQLALTSQFVWGVNPQTQALYFCAPTLQTAPSTVNPLTSTLALWDSISAKFDAANYRNRQAVKLSFDAFEHSKEFFVGAGQQSFTLARPVEQVVVAYITLSTCNTATITFTGQPSAGDTITIGPASGAWQAGHIYALGGIIIINGFVQKVTTAGTSGGSIPTFSTVTGGTTTDNSVIWTCQGPSGLNTGVQTYTFVLAANLDNTQFGQVAIQGSEAATIQALVDAINANIGTRGSTFSLPTWENSQCNAITVTGTTFILQQKNAGSGWIAAISTSSTAFSSSSANTTGGTSPQGSVGPNEPATITIQVYAAGTSTAAPGLAYTQGSAVVTLATPLNSGTNLNVEYTRVDGNVIQCENTAAVTALAAITSGTGRVQQFTDQSTTGLISTNALSGLQLCQQALASYGVLPSEYVVVLYQPGLFPGQAWVWNLTAPLDVLNGTYYIEEVTIELVPTFPWLDNPNAAGAGHYRYSIRVDNIAQIQSYMDFWEGNLGGGSGGSSGLVATSGGALSPAGSQAGGTLLIEVNGTNSSSQAVLNLTAGANVTLTDTGGGAISIAANTTVASADVTGKTAAFTVLTFTPGTLGTYRVGGYVTITAVLLDVLQLQLSWTDETANARTLVMLPVGGAGLSTVGAFSFPPVDIRAASGSAISLAVALTTGTGTITYDAGGSFMKMS